MKRIRKAIGFAIFLVLLNGLFYPTAIPLNICKTISLTSYFILFLFALKYFAKYKFHNFFKPILLVIVAVLCTIITSFFFHEQSILHTFRLTLPWFGLGFCFYLQKKHTNLDIVYYGIFIFCMIYLMCYIIAVYYAPNIIFDNSGGLDSGAMNVQRGWYRVRISGGEFNHLMLYWQLNKFTTTHKKKNLLFAFYFLTIIILGLSRQHMLIAIILTLYILLTKLKWYYRIITAVLSFILIVHIIPQTSIYQNLLELTAKQMIENSGGTEDIRIQAYEYYLFDYNKNIFQNIIGNGLYHADSSWGKEMYRIMRNDEVILSDVGYASLYFKLGFIGLLFLGIFIWKIMSCKVCQNYLFIKYYTVAVLLGSIFSNQFEASFLSFSIIYYIMYQRHISPTT